MKQYMIKKLAVCVVAGLALMSCNRDKEELEEIFDSAEDHALLEGEYSNVHDFMDNQAQEKPGFGKANGTILSACAQVYTNTSSNPKILKITFYDSSNAANNYACLCNDGNYRRGTISCEFTGAYRTLGSQVVVKLENYFVNDVQYTGTRTITNLGNSSGHFKYSFVVSGASAITSSGTATWTSQGTLDRIEGDATINPLDDVYLITGTSSGTSRKGKSYTVAVSTPLKKRIGCRNIVSGLLNITNSGGNTMTLNFDPIGGENCDRLARISYKGKTKDITLR